MEWNSKHREMKFELRKANRERIDKIFLNLEYLEPFLSFSEEEEKVIPDFLCSLARLSNSLSPDRFIQALEKFKP